MVVNKMNAVNKMFSMANCLPIVHYFSKSYISGMMMYSIRRSATMLAMTLYPVLQQDYM